MDVKTTETQKQGTEPKYLADMQSALKLKHYTRRTQETYIHWIKRYQIYLKNHPDLHSVPSQQKAESFLSSLAKDVAAATQNQALNALLFFYRNVMHVEFVNIRTLRAKRNVRVPIVMSKDETRRLLNCITGEIGLICRLLYGAGLRLEEGLSLRIKDIDFDYKTITIHAGKVDKDGVVQLPETLIGPLQEHLKGVKALHEYDLRTGFGRVMLPEALERKYPSYAQEWEWQWVFPAHNISTDPETGIRRRHHFYSWDVQKAVKNARKCAGIIKPITPHTLRHCYATHLLEALLVKGWRERDALAEVQKSLRHKNPRTTEIYIHLIHPAEKDVRSPLDEL